MEKQALNLFDHRSTAFVCLIDGSFFEDHPDVASRFPVGTQGVVLGNNDAGEVFVLTEHGLMMLPCFDGFLIRTIPTNDAARALLRKLIEVPDAALIPAHVDSVREFREQVLKPALNTLP